MSTQWQPSITDVQQPGGWVVAHYKQHFLADSNGVLFAREWLKKQDLSVIAEHGIGHFNGDAVYLLELDQAADIPGFIWQSLRQFMLQGDADMFRMLSFATQIGTWAREHRFCGSCGEAMQQVAGERAMQCSRCEIRDYPRLSPSMIVLVTDGDQILLARSPRFVSGIYSTLAGFVEAGESVEQCVAREVLEEVGVQVKNVHYLGSQGWPFPHSLMLGFHAQYASGDIVLQPEEIEDARWFSVHELPPLPASRSIARYLIDVYVAQRLGMPEPVLPS